MTSKWMKPELSAKNRQLDFVNTIVQVHNLHCGCPEPLQHAVADIFQQEPSIKEQCLGTTKDQPTTDDDGFGAGDLDALFAVDFGEEKEDTTAR